MNSKHYRVSDDKKLNLDKRPTRGPALCDSKDEYATLLAQHIADLSDQQDLFYADNRYALLVIFQAMDAAGKDSAVKHVMSGINPQGCEVFSFKQPSVEELDHDFLWRTTCRLPERGRIGIFNRSYYEEVLITRVHPRILDTEHLPDQKDIWTRRYQSIVDLERHLHRNGTRVVKFFLHLSKEEQRKRFLHRLDDPKKNWKISPSDIQERKFWKRYMSAYEDAIAATATRHAPWHIVPADDKDDAHLIISHILLEVFKSLDLAYPKPDAQKLQDLQAMKKTLLGK